MLSRREEQRVASILEATSVKNNRSHLWTEDFPQQTLNLMRWLAEKLKECNAANYQIMHELQKTNEELARLREHYEG